MPPSSRNPRRKPVRTPGAGQPRPASSTSLLPLPSQARKQRLQEPPDYSQDYADVRQDLRLTAIISTLLLISMVGLTFVL